MSTQPDKSLAPIEETDDAVSYAGVRLPKAESRESPLVPKKEKYAEYINDRFSVLQLQQKLAISFLMGEPILIEGGTSIGKTTAVRKMASELGWEVHYVNLNGATDVEDLMGKYIPNPNKRQPNDPEYIFADGRVTSGLRQQKGRIKVVILDEFNSAAPNVLIRLHEVLDALERGGSVVLSEDASEDITTSKQTTKVVAFTNPPGKGYVARPALDPAQLRRWVYQKLPDHLPDAAFSFAVDALFSQGEAHENIPHDNFLSPRSEPVPSEQFAEIPGLDVILQKYKEFHRAAKGLLQQRSIGSNQPQPFTYDDREEPRRVRDFVARFYNGDITETFQKALRYYYVNKLIIDEDRAKLEELINHVSYTAPATPSKRKGLDAQRVDIDAEIEERQQQILDLLGEKLVPSETKRTAESSSEREAAEVMGEGKFFGSASLDTMIPGWSAALEKLRIAIPPLPPRAEMERHAKRGDVLRLRVSKAPDGSDLTMKRVNELLQDDFKKKKDGKVLYDATEEWKLKSTFFTKDTPEVAWAFTTDTVLPDSTNKNYLDQTQFLADFLRTQLFKGEKLPKEYEEAIREFESQKAEITKLMGSDWKEAAKKLSALRLNQLRAAPVEALFDFVQTLRGTADKRRTLVDKYTWTNKLSSGGHLVGFGFCDSDGAGVGDDPPDYTLGSLGVALSRKFP